MGALTIAVKVLLALALVTPLVVVPSSFIYPFIVPKILVMRAIVDVALGLWVVLAVSRWDRFGVQRSPITIVMGLYMLSFGISTVLGVDVYRSLWDTHERMLGLYTVLHFGAYYVVATTMLRSWEDWRPFLRLFVAVGATIAVVAVWQRFVDPQAVFNQGNVRVSSTLGHPSYLGGVGATIALLAVLLGARAEGGPSGAPARQGLLGLAGALAIAFGLGCLAVAWGYRDAGPELVALFGADTFLGGAREIVSSIAFVGILAAIAGAVTVGQVAGWSKRGPAWWWIEVGLLVVAGILGVVAVVVSETRGTLLGLVAGVIVLGVSYALVVARKGWLRWALGGAAVAAVLLVASLVALRDWEGLRDIPLAGRFYKISFEGGTLHTRVMAWEIAVEAAQDSPVFGWGPNNYYFAHNQFFDPRFLRYGYLETWFDNAHNVLFNTLAVQGGFGLLVYLTLLGLPVVLLWRGYRRGEIGPHFACVMTAWLAMHTMHNIAVFENPTSWLYLVMMLALLNSELRREPSPHRGILVLKTPALAAVAVALVPLLWLGVIEPARANMAGLDTVRLVGEGKHEAARERFEWSASRPCPHRDGVRNMLAEHVLKRAGALIDARAKQIDFDQEGQKRSADAIARAEAKGPAGKLEVDRLRAAEVRRAAGVRQRLDEYERELERLQSMAHYTFDELAKNVELHPLDVRVVIGRAKLAQALAAWLGDDSLLEVMEPELAQTIPKSPRRQELAYLLAAIQQELALRGMRELERALQASPHVEALRRQQALIQLRHVPSLRAAAEALPAGDGLRADLERAIAAIELEQRRYDEAEALLRRTIEDDEEIDEGWWRLAMLLNARRKLAEARAVVAEAEGKVGRVSAQGQQVFDAIRATAPAAPEAPAAPAAPVAPGAPGS